MSTATPTRADPLRDTPLARSGSGLDLCVHCGFCLQACPTYLALDNENDSPRGRLVLMRGLLDGDVSLDDDAVALHLDQCLDCRGCESACPSGVPYGHLLEATRATLATRRPHPWRARLVLAVFASSAWRAVALGMARLLRDLRLSALLRRLPGAVGFSFGMLEATRRSPLPVAPARDQHRPSPLDLPPDGAGAATSARRGGSTPPPTVDASAQRPSDGLAFAILEGCVMKTLFAATNRATTRVLHRRGYRERDAAGQRCCGALHAHAGDGQTARQLARANIDAFERSGADYVVVNAAGCGAMMKEYAHLLSNDPEWGPRAERLAAKVRDVTELLAFGRRGPSTGALPIRLAYDAPCHLHHAQRVTTAPLDALSRVRGLTLVPLRDADQCCGSAGIYNLLQPEISRAVLAPKLAAIAASGAEWIATGNPGCLMQIGAGLRQVGSAVRVVHPVDVIDAVESGDDR